MHYEELMENVVKAFEVAGSINCPSRMSRAPVWISGGSRDFRDGRDDPRDIESSYLTWPCRPTHIQACALAGSPDDGGSFRRTTSRSATSVVIRSG